MKQRFLSILAASSVVCSTFLMASASFSQGRTSGQDLDLLTSDEKTTSAPSKGSELFRSIALESTVDPDIYFVGPSDIFAISISIGSPQVYTIAVTPEGTLIIPTVGEVKVSDMTLSAAKRKIIEAIRKRYLAKDMSVTLFSPRPIMIMVTGNVLNPGSFQLTSVDRADRAIEHANKPTRLQNQDDIQRVLAEASTRNIILRHKDQTVSRVDLAKFMATKDDNWNPYLREGDVVIVPRKNPAKNVIAVYGEVNMPGRFEYAPEDSIKDALRLAQGFTRLAMTDSVEFSRLSKDGTVIVTKILDGMKLLDGIVPDAALEPGDRVVVRSDLDLREDYRIGISGEVHHPGIYPITKNKTRLSEIIKLAGGFTEYAALKSATLNRRSIGSDDVQLERLLSLRGGAAAEDSAYFFLETELRIKKEIVNVDFEKLIKENDPAQDIILQSEDYIIVPSERNTIYVFGQVVSPGHIPYVAGESADFYVRKAGGFTDRARSGDMKVIKAKTKQWLSPRETRVEEGDYVWVPKDPDRSFLYYTTIVSQVATVLSAIVGVAVVIATLKR